MSHPGSQGGRRPTPSRERHTVMTITTTPRTTDTRRRPPLGVRVIAGFYVFGAIVLLVGMLTNPGEISRVIAERHALPPDTGVVLLPVVAGLALAIAYGLV